MILMVWVGFLSVVYSLSNQAQSVGAHKGCPSSLLPVKLLSCPSCLILEEGVAFDGWWTCRHIVLIEFVPLSTLLPLSPFSFLPACFQNPYDVRWPRWCFRKDYQSTVVHPRHNDTDHPPLSSLPLLPSCLVFLTLRVAYARIDSGPWLCTLRIPVVSMKLPLLCHKTTQSFIAVLLQATTPSWSLSWIRARTGHHAVVQGGTKMKNSINTRWIQGQR